MIKRSNIEMKNTIYMKTRSKIEIEYYRNENEIWNA